MEPEVTIDEEVLKPFDKMLYQNRSKTQNYRDTLLELSRTLVGSIDQGALKARMEELAENYTALLDNELEADRNDITAALTEEPKEISRTDYDEDAALLKAVSDIAL